MFGEAFMQSYNGDEKLFETGFSEIDSCLRGITKGSIITIGSRPAMGKSSFAISVCNHLLEIGKKVLFFELDNSEAIAERQFISVKTQIPLFYLHNNSQKSDWEKIKDTIEFFGNENFELLCKMNLTIDEAEEKIKEKKPDVVFFDCIQCIKMPKAPNITEAINLAIKEIKRIADENNIIVVLTSQLSRSGLYRCNHKPILSDLRNGSLLEDLSDVIMFVHREEYYDRDNKDVKNKAEIIFNKNKFGELNLLCLKFEHGIFRDFSTEDYIRKVFI